VDESPYSLDETMNAIVLMAYNEDTVNDHEVQLRVTMHEGEADDLVNLSKLMDALRGY